MISDRILLASVSVVDCWIGVDGITDAMIGSEKIFRELLLLLWVPSSLVSSRWERRWRTGVSISWKGAPSEVALNMMKRRTIERDEGSSKRRRSWMLRSKKEKERRRRKERNKSKNFYAQRKCG